MKLRLFLAIVSGTILNAACLGFFALANGTPVPSMKTPSALLAYPTGSAWATFIFAWVIYAMCLFVFCLFPRRKSSAR